MITITHNTYWIFVLLFAVGILVAPSVTLYLMSWKSFGGWYTSSLVSTIIILSVITVCLHILL